jgi:hypothetical protein
LLGNCRASHRLRGRLEHINLSLNDKFAVRSNPKHEKTLIWGR